VLVLLNDGYSIDDALTRVYGFNLSGLDDAWLKYMTSTPQDIAVPGKITWKSPRTAGPVINDLALSPVAYATEAGGS